MKCYTVTVALLCSVRSRSLCSREHLYLNCGLIKESKFLTISMYNYNIADNCDRDYNS